MMSSGGVIQKDPDDWQPVIGRKFVLIDDLIEKGVLNA